MTKEEVLQLEKELSFQEFNNHDAYQLGQIIVDHIEKNHLKNVRIRIVLDKDIISLDESVTDNILLEIPLQILAENEEAEELPSGKFWSVLSEEDYAKQQEDKKEEKKSPFDGLNGLFD